MKEFSESSLLGAVADVFSVDLDTVQTTLASGGRFEAGSAALREIRSSLYLASGSSREAGTVVGRFFGEIGLTKLRAFREALYGLVHEDLQKVILDLHAVSLSRTAVGELVAFAAAMHGREKRLYLFRVSHQLRELLAELEIQAFFSYLETEDDVLAALVI